MSWVDDNLGAGEEVLYRGKNSIIILLWPILLMPLHAAFDLRTEAGIWRVITIPIRFLIWAVIGVFYLPSAIASFVGSEAVVTTHRVIGTNKGLLTRKVFEINLSNVESLQVRQSIFERIVNKGEITFYGASHDLVFPDMPNPAEFRRQTMAAVSRQGD